MRKSLWIMLAVLLVAIGAPSAHADSYTPIFTTTGCSGTCALPTALDVTFPSPATIDVTYVGFFTETVSIPGGPGDTYGWIANVERAVFDFELSDGSLPTCNGGIAQTSCGTLTFAAVSAPEPSSVALMLLGVGLVFVMRKRIGQRLPQAS
jgi:PEP-CTERM motif